MANEKYLQYGIAIISESVYPKQHSTENGIVYLTNGEDDEGEELCIETPPWDPSFIFVRVGYVGTKNYLRELPSPPEWFGDVVNELQRLMPDCECKWTIFETER